MVKKVNAPKTGLTTKHWFGYMFGDIPDLDTRNKMADNGEKLICGMVERMDTAHVVEHLRKLEVYGRQNEANYPWSPLPETTVKIQTPSDEGGCPKGRRERSQTTPFSPPSHLR